MTPVPHVGPTLPFSQELHAKKYRGPGETFRDAMNRVAGGLSDGPGHFHEFRDMLMDMRFLPAGRIQSAIGAARQTTAYNCFVSGAIEDSFIEGHGSIMERAKQAAATMRLGGGIGYDFSTLRPRGAQIRKLGSQSSGPIAFMGIFDAVCRCVASSGHRRGAQMGVMRVDHPDIVEFIHAKQSAGALSGFNLSLAITDEFMECVEAGLPFQLRWGGEAFQQVDARELWDTVMRSTWDWAEPGVLFVDTINRLNNLSYCEVIAATNPCGEQPLPPFGACLLGSFNLAKYVTKQSSGTEVSYHLDLDRLAVDVPTAVRAMDNVVDRSLYPLYEQEKEAKSKRRMGLGVTGLANALEAEGHSYGSHGFLQRQSEVLSLIERASYRASALLAQEKGRFPLYSAPHYLAAPHVAALDGETRDLIRRHGIRNSHLTSIAPTGTISSCADNVSSGVEPVFAYAFDRTVQSFEGPKTETITDYGVREFGVRGRRAQDVTVSEHLDVLACAQQHVDSAVSKTCNVPGSVGWDEFKGLYLRAWALGCKGVTTFRTDGKRGGVLVSRDDAPAVVAQAAPEPVALACEFDPASGRRSCE